MNSTVAFTEKTLKLLNSTAGRDRFNRFAQFFAKFAGLTLSNQSLLALSAAISQARKPMRAFKQIELIQAVIKARSIKDDTIRTSMILKNSSFTLWLVFDFVSWLHFAKVIESTPEFSKYIGDLANRFWLAGLLCSLAGNLYKLSQNQRKLEMEIKAVKYAASKNDIDEGAEKAIRLLKGAFGDIVNATVHDAIECTIPALGLELLPSIISPTIVALAATATSITGGISLWTSL